MFRSRAKSRKLFTSGIKPLASYGAEVTGFTDSQLLRLSRIEAQFLTPKTRGRSLDAVLLLRNETTAPLAAAALTRWAREVWEASACKRPRGLSLPECRRVWAGIPEVNGWRAVKGPIGAARQEAIRRSWSFTNAFEAASFVCGFLRVYKFESCLFCDGPLTQLFGW